MTEASPLLTQQPPVVVETFPVSGRAGCSAGRSGNSRAVQQGHGVGFVELVHGVEGFAAGIHRGSSLRFDPQDMRRQGPAGAEQDLRFLAEQLEFSRLPGRARARGGAVFVCVPDEGGMKEGVQRANYWFNCDAMD